MITRLLPKAEWNRIPDEGLPAYLREASPEDIAVVVVEDGDRIVARWCVLRLTHLEGVWVDPQYRNAGVIRGLIRKTLACARAWSHWAITGAVDDNVRGILARLGAKKIDMDFYALGLKNGRL